MDGSIQHQAHPVFLRQTFPIPALHCVKFLTLQNEDYHGLKLLQGADRSSKADFAGMLNCRTQDTFSYLLGPEGPETEQEKQV